ncbi:MAG: hypothetical protein OK474_06090 [Thaumarchaeota archaeon]|nr:hypothetical protein [Nitrososphaerota archaeon]
MDARTYVASVAEESLGLAAGSLKPETVPDELVSGFSSALRGEATAGAEGPLLERLMLSPVLAAARDAALSEDGYLVRKARWPGAAPFAVCLTHDVDNISRPRSHLWRTRSRFSAPELVAGLLGLVSLYDNVKLLAKGEGSRGFHSSFYYLSSNYPLGAVRPESDRIRASGWDVGLHGDFGTHDSQEKMDEAVTRFSGAMGFRPTGLREHYLRFDFAKSWPIMEAAGFDYDTTVGTNDRLGFKIGMASPFHPPDGAWSPMNLLELPLVLMDTTLWGYLKRSEEEGFSDSLRMMKDVEDVEGLFTLLWHQEAVRMKGGRIYWRLLDEIARRGCFVGSGAEISRWWRSRSTPLVKRGNLIRLDGQPPHGLVLRLNLAEGRTPRVSSGSIERRGDEYLVRPEGPDFALEVDH